MGTRARDLSQNLGTGGAGGNVSLADLLPYLTTANVTELGNLYFSNDRVFANLQLASINDLFDVNTSNITANIGFGLVWDGTYWVPGPVTANLNNLTTDSLAEGNTNLYFSNTRVREAIGAANPTIIYDPNTGLFSANLEAVALSANTTDAVPEGFINQYFTNARVFANLQLASLNDLYDVDYLGNTPFPNALLVYNYQSNTWQPASLSEVTEALVANTVRSISNFTSDDLREGNVNFYLNIGRFANLLANASINDLRDVDTTGNLEVGYVLGWDGNKWIPIEANVLGGAGGGNVFGSGDFAERSNIANVALYALLANVAEFATFAATAGVVEVATFANTSGVAQVANYANTAGFASLADRANVATYAEIANSVSSALVAERANVANIVLSLGNFSTNDLREGNLNLYYTDVRVETNIRGMSIDILQDVSTANRGLYDVLMWTGTQWEANAVVAGLAGGGAVERANVANLVLSLSNFTSDDLQEGTVNQYYNLNKLNADIQVAVTGKDFSFKNLDLSGNLTVSGNIVTIGTDIVDIFTPIVTLKNPTPDGVGIRWDAGNVELIYDELREGLRLSKNLIVDGNILPAISGVYNLGSPDRKFRSVFIGATTVYLGNLRLSEGPDGQLQIYNAETGEAAAASLANVSATQYVTVDRLDSQGNEILSFIGGNVNQFLSGTTGNLYFGIANDGNIREQFSGVRLERKLYDSANIQTDVIIYADREGDANTSAALAEFKGDGNIVLNGQLLVTGKTTFLGNVSLALPEVALNTNTAIIDTYTNTDVAVSYQSGVITVNKDGVYESTAILTLTEDWQDTPVKAAFIPTGTYVVQVIANDSAVGGGHTQEYYSGVMSWYSSDTNSGTADEIALHRAGAGPGNGTIFLRIQRTLTANSDDLKLQIAGTTANSGTSSYNFKFRRLL